MIEVTPAVQDLARRLIAQEARQVQGSETGINPALRAVEKLSNPLSKLSGAEGFRSLLTRALTLASAYAPSLSPLRIETDGSVKGAGDLPLSQTADEAAEGGVALMAELIGLLIVFIGEALTLQVLRAAWPNATLKHMSMEQKESLP